MVKNQSVRWRKRSEGSLRWEFTVVKASTFHSRICQQSFKSSEAVSCLLPLKIKKNLPPYRLPDLCEESCSLLLSYVMLTYSFNRPFLIDTYYTCAQSAHEHQIIQFIIDPACCGNHASGLCGITPCLGSPVVLAAAAFGSVR